MKTTLDIAMMRWEAASSQNRSRYGTQATILLGPFLAGWYLRDMGVEDISDKVGIFRASFYAGWRECDGTLRIKARDEPHPFIPDDRVREPNEMQGPPSCKTCGLVEHHRDVHPRGKGG